MNSFVKILLCNPKYPHNVGAAVRAASCFGVNQVVFTGTRVMDPHDDTIARKLRRIPREERLRAFKDVTCTRYINVTPYMIIRDLPEGVTPVCVEFDDTAVPLPYFEHPRNAMYVFGPEDGSVTPAVRSVCHRFVRIPTEHCMNLGAAVNVTFYDRMLKETLGWSATDSGSYELSRP